MRNILIYILDITLNPKKKQKKKLMRNILIYILDITLNPRKKQKKKLICNTLIYILDITLNPRKKQKLNIYTRKTAVRKRTAVLLYFFKSQTKSVFCFVKLN